MGIFVVMALGFFAVALVSSQLPAYLAVGLYVLNVAAYFYAWDFDPMGFIGAREQTIHIVILLGGQSAHMLGLFLPLFTDSIDSWPRWTRAFVVGLVTLPLWLTLPVLFYG